jgi:prolyl oligopeptidase
MPFPPDPLMSNSLALSPPPFSPKSDTVDDFHGTPVPDPYRWLEESDNPEVQAWTKAHNLRTRAFLDQIPCLEDIKARLTELWNYPKYESIHKAGGKYFITRNDGLQNQAVLYIQETLNNKPTVLLDPNTLSEDGTVALMQQSYSNDGSLLGYSLAAGGSDWQEIHILGTKNREAFNEVLQWCKFPGIAWTADNRGFFYNRLTKPDNTWGDDTHLLSQVYWHTLGTPQSSDLLIYQKPDDPGLRYWPTLTEDKTTLVLQTSRGTDRRNGIYLRPVDSSAEFRHLVEDGEAKFWLAGNHGNTFYLLTDLEAPHGRVIAIDIENPTRENWVEVIPEGHDVLADAVLWDSRLVVVTLHNAYNQVKVYDLNGCCHQDIPMPTMGTVELLEGKQDDPEIFLSFESFLYPRTIFRYDLDSGEITPIHDSPVDFDIQAYQTSQIFYPSKDSTRVPMFLTHKKDLALNGDNPTILYAYGGFTLSQPPFFNVWNLVWLEMGGVFALANIRGGTEYGEGWHRAGMLESKQNVFDDFIAAAEWLIDKGYTSTRKLAIEGRSNGGLLTSACMVQRPDLYGAVLCWVPVTDMLRFHKFTVGRFWTPEYGNAEENPDHFKFLYAYSPLHNLKTGVVYPPIILTTGDSDDRVVPAHSKKFIAALLDTTSGDAPHLLRIDLKAGHKLGKPTYKLIEEHADVLAFAVYALDMNRWG